MFDLSVCRDVDKKGFVDPIRTLTLAQLKQEQTDRSRTPTGKDVHLHRLYLDPHCKARQVNTQVHYSTYILLLLLLATLWLLVAVGLIVVLHNMFGCV